MDTTNGYRRHREDDKRKSVAVQMPQVRTQVEILFQGNACALRESEVSDTLLENKMKSYAEYFQDSIDMTDGSVTMTEKDYKAIQKDAIESAAAIVHSEPKLPGEMPDSFFAGLATKEGATELFRATVDQTMDNVKGRILKLAK